LSALEGVSEVQTDVEEMTCRFVYDRTRIESLSRVLDELAAKNDKLADWSVIDE
jgi:hypothetical protein